MMNKTAIDWCDFTWNPVTGCLYTCPYCYARNQARRFSGDIRLNLASPQITQTGPRTYVLEQPFKTDAGRTLLFPAGFAPTLHRYRLPMPAQKKKPATIFVCSVADLFGPGVPTSWIVAVLDACAAAPWHNYLFLTKNPERYQQLDELALLPHADNFWYGTTITRQREIARRAFLPEAGHRFISIEPIQEAVDLYQGPPATHPIEWVIVGAETGQQKHKKPPQNEWLKTIVTETKDLGIPVLLKDSQELRAVWEGELIQEFPHGLEPMPGNDVPHCKTCPHHKETQQGRRGISVTCAHPGTATGPVLVPAQYARHSPKWCPLREEAKRK